jgi:hypothetical protein
MDRIALGVSVVAVAAATWLGIRASDLAREVESLRDASAALEARVAAAERDAAATRARREAPPPLSQEASANLSPSPPPASLASASRPATLAEVDRRLAALEKAAVEGYRWVDAAAAPPVAVQTAEPDVEPTLPEERWYGSVEDAAKHLELTSAQRADFERVVAEAKEEIDALHHLPDAEGKTWEQVQKDGVSFPGGMLQYDGSGLQAFREKTIPGRSESYGAAERRIAADARKRLRDSLTTTQRERFDRARPDGMLGTSSVDGFMSILSFSSAFDAVPAPPPVPEPASEE